MNFSLEIGPHTDLETLPPVKDVYVTMLPGGKVSKSVLGLISSEKFIFFSIIILFEKAVKEIQPSLN